MRRPRRMNPFHAAARLLHSRSVSLCPGALCRIYFLVVTTSAFRVYGFLEASTVQDFRCRGRSFFDCTGQWFSPLFQFFFSGIVPSAFADPLDLTIFLLLYSPLRP